MVHDDGGTCRNIPHRHPLGSIPSLSLDVIIETNFNQVLKELVTMRGRMTGATIKGNVSGNGGGPKDVFFGQVIDLIKVVSPLSSMLQDGQVGGIWFVTIFNYATSPTVVCVGTMTDGCNGVEVGVVNGVLGGVCQGHSHPL